MRARGIYVWDLLREQLWFLPGLGCLLAGVLAFVCISLDQRFAFGNAALMPWMETTGAAARTLLGALVGGLVTVTGLVFSVAMLAVSQTASQYGPRLIRNILESKITQIAISLHVGTIVYCMILLRSIREEEFGNQIFTPHLSVLMAELLGAACLFSLLAFANQMTRTLRAETLLSDIHAQLLMAADHLFPKDSLEHGKPAPAERSPSWQGLNKEVELESVRVGYVQTIDLDGLMSRAEREGHRLELQVRPGDFVLAHSVLALVESSSPLEASTLREYRRCFLLGEHRTPREDIEAGMLELVEAGLRALSPGVNDPRTAINAIDYLSSVLSRLAGWQWPSNILLDKQGIQRIRVQSTDFAGALNTAFDQMRQSAGKSVGVLCRLVEALRMIRKSASTPTELDAIDRQLEMVLRQAEREIAEPNDLADIRSRAN